MTVLGSSGLYAEAGNACSGYLVEASGHRVMVDAGPGTLAHLQEHCALGALDALVLSHAHPDHWLELPVMMNAFRWAVGRRAVPVFGPADLLATVERHLGGSSAPTLDWRVVQDGSVVTTGPLAMRFSRTDHPGETLAVRCEADGRSLVYTADTGPAWDASGLGPTPGLLVCEATYSRSAPAGHPSADPMPDRAPVHLTAAQAGALGRSCGASSLLLTHLVPGSDPERYRVEAEAEFGSGVGIARPHLRVEL